MDKVIDVICYLANSKDVTNLFKVKMMKLLWYIDAFVYGNNPEGKDVPEDSNKVVITSKMASPVTGDNTSATLWFGLAVVSMVSVAVVVDKKRKATKTE